MNIPLELYDLMDQLIYLGLLTSQYSWYVAFTCTLIMIGHIKYMYNIKVTYSFLNDKELFTLILSIWTLFMFSINMIFLTTGNFYNIVGFFEVCMHHVTTRLFINRLTVNN